MRPRTNAADNLAGFDASGHECVGNQRAVATPRQRLSAHQYDLFTLRELNTAAQTRFERRSLHVVGIAAEAGIPPSHVRGIGPGAAEAAQSGDVPVVHPSPVEGRGQATSIELRIVQGPRDPAHVNDPLDPVRLQQTEEGLYRPCRVPDREDDKRSHIISLS